MSRILMQTEDKILVQPRNCPWCNKKHKPIEMHRGFYDRWVKGESLDKLLPSWTEDQRRILATGVCPACNKKQGKFYRS